VKRWVINAAALVVAALAVTLCVVACGPNVRRVAIEIGAIGWVLLALTQLWRPVILTAAMIGLAMPAVLLVMDQSGHGATAVPMAALLVATGELAGWSYDRRSIVPEAAAVTAARTAGTAALTVGAAIVAAGVLAVSGLPAPGGVLPLLAGAGATLAIVAFAALRRW